MLWKLAEHVVVAFDSVLGSFLKELLKVFPSWSVSGNQRHNKLIFVGVPLLSFIILLEAPPSFTALPLSFVSHVGGDC